MVTVTDKRYPEIGTGTVIPEPIPHRRRDDDEPVKKKGDGTIVVRWHKDGFVERIRSKFLNFLG